MNTQQRLWAPWRTPYLTRPPGQRRRCIFCAAKRSRHNRRVYVVCRGRTTFGLLNTYPYNNGHVMISPYRHVGTLGALTAHEQQDLFGMATRLTQALSRALHPDGFNLGINIGRTAGAGIPGHLHLHVVPRWRGDTNFMPTIGGTKIISQSLEALYDTLTAELAASR